MSVYLAVDVMGCEGLGLGSEIRGLRCQKKHIINAEYHGLTHQDMRRLRSVCSVRLLLFPWCCHRV